MSLQYTWDLHYPTTSSSEGCLDIPRETHYPSKDGNNGLDTEADCILLQQQRLWKPGQPSQHLVLAEGQAEMETHIGDGRINPTTCHICSVQYPELEAALALWIQQQEVKGLAIKGQVDQDKGRENSNSIEHQSAHQQKIIKLWELWSSPEFPKFNYFLLMIWKQSGSRWVHLDPEKEGPFHLINWLKPFLFGHSFGHSNDDIQVHKALEFKSATDCSRFVRSGSLGVSLFLYPPCHLGVVLLALE